MNKPLLIPAMEPVWVGDEAHIGEVMWELAMEVPGGLFVLESLRARVLYHEDLLRLPREEVSTLTPMKWIRVTRSSRSGA